VKQRGQVRGFVDESVDTNANMIHPNELNTTKQRMDLKQIKNMTFV